MSDSYIDLPPLDLDLDLPIKETAREWFTPFTSQYERGEWDWESHTHTKSPHTLLGSNGHDVRMGMVGGGDGPDDEDNEEEEEGKEWYEIAGSDTSTGSDEEDGGKVDIEDIEPIEYEMGYGLENRKDV